MKLDFGSSHMEDFLGLCPLIWAQTSGFSLTISVLTQTGVSGYTQRLSHTHHCAVQTHLNVACRINVKLCPQLSLKWFCRVRCWREIECLLQNASPTKIKGLPHTHTHTQTLHVCGNIFGTAATDKRKDDWYTNTKKKKHISKFFLMLSHQIFKKPGRYKL